LIKDDYYFICGQHGHCLKRKHAWNTDDLAAPAFRAPTRLSVTEYRLASSSTTSPPRERCISLRISLATSELWVTFTGPSSADFAAGAFIEECRDGFLLKQAAGKFKEALPGWHDRDMLDAFWCGNALSFGS